LFFLLFDSLLLFYEQVVMIGNLLFLFNELLFLLGDLSPPPLIEQGRRIATSWRIASRTTASHWTAVQCPTHAIQ